MIAHVGCRTGFPDDAITDKLPGSTIVGVDMSSAALDLARSKASLHSGMRATYEVADSLPTGLPADGFTHALAIHPLCEVEGRSRLLGELRRILMPGGQALLALPVRGSFPELNDMIREFALRQDLPTLSKAVDVAASRRPTIETISEEFENAGLTEVDVDVQLIAVSFNNGREFLEDPIARLMVMPDMRLQLPVEPTVLEPALRYVHEAILKYWSEGVFELTVNVGCASGRRF
jgi:ubiquinone/menaquinone biosynthesis C-methylase UbiE